MYNDFFGFRERPFRLVPDPTYLFLSKSHEEALAHLIYAVSQGEGFVKIIGEAGTGKTTLCRAFLDRLEKKTDVAYIFNPKLDSLQLLKAINDEFGIDSKADNIKALIDSLNVFLMEKNAEGNWSILLIDEAQNLSKEVLEQLRLLSNLETTTSKLLQIILVGQPELADTLASYELRQLEQRITLSCCLKPLTHHETKAYVRHRIDIASQGPGIKFSRAALRSIYRYSRGIPRLINIASDRSLILAFSLNRHKIGIRETKAAINELAGSSNIRPYSVQRKQRPVFMLLLLFGLIFLFIFYHFELSDTTTGNVKSLKSENITPLVSPAQENKKNLSSENKAIKSDFLSKSNDNLENFLKRMGGYSSRKNALRAVFKLWETETVFRPQLEKMENDNDFFRIAAIQNGFSSLLIQNDLELVKKLNLPVILKCYLPQNHTPKYVVIKAIEGRDITLIAGVKDVLMKAQIGELKSCWSGSGHVLWKNSLGLVTISPFRLSKDSVLSVKMLLQNIGFSNIQFNTSYDHQTKEAIKQIQTRHGINADGIVGPLTKIVLNSEVKTIRIPHLTKSGLEFSYGDPLAIDKQVKR